MLVMWLNMVKFVVSSSKTTEQIKELCQNITELIYPSHGCFIMLAAEFALTHWGQVTHICISNLTTIVSDNGLLPVAPFTNMV